MKRALFATLAFLSVPLTAQAQTAVSYPPECHASTGEIICARLDPGTGTLQDNGYCAQLTNHSTRSYFIPLRTGTERADFLNNLTHLNVQVAVCCLSPHCRSVN